MFHRYHCAPSLFMTCRFLLYYVEELWCLVWSNCLLGNISKFRSYKYRQGVGRVSPHEQAPLTFGRTALMLLCADKLRAVQCLCRAAITDFVENYFPQNLSRRRLTVDNESIFSAVLWYTVSESSNLGRKTFTTFTIFFRIFLLVRTAFL